MEANSCVSCAMVQLLFQMNISFDDILKQSAKIVRNRINFNITEKLNILLNKLVGICTDGASSVAGKSIGAVTLLE